MRIRFLVLVVLSLPFSALAQDSKYIDSLKNAVAVANGETKINLLGQLSSYYFSLDKKQSDQYATEHKQVAELSRDRKLMVKSLLWDAQRYYSQTTAQENINQGLAISKKARELASSSNLKEMEAWADFYLALGYRSNTKYDEAMSYNNTALALAIEVGNDSLLVSAYNSLGHTYLAKKEKMQALRNYLQALNLAETSDRYVLMRNCYFNMASFYQSIEEYEKAKDYIYKVIPLTIRFKQPLDRIEVYNRLGQIYSNNKQYDLAMSFFEKSIALADTLKFEVMKMNAYGRMIEMYLGSNKMEKALEVFKAKPEFVDLLKNSGFDYVVDQAYGMAYIYLGKLDSGYFFMKRAENGFETRSSITNRFWYYMNMNTYYRKKQDYKNALVYSLKAKSVSDGIGDLGLKKEVAQNLDSVYQELGDFKNAYSYNNQTQQLTDSLKKLSAEKEVLLLEVEDEKKRNEREAAQAAEAKIARHNIQYMGITTAIAAIFILLVVLGVFSVSQSTIKIIGFFAFIFLFEFIILLADNQIHHWTHGEPWKILGIKIGLISILLPLHHFLEEKVIHYLTSKKLMQLNKVNVFAALSQRKGENV